MRSTHKNALSRTVAVALGAALAASLAACDVKPLTGKLDNDSDRTAQNAGRKADRLPVDGVQKPDHTVRGEKTAIPPADDALLTAKVKSALIAEPTLSRSLMIDVNASGGAIILKGVANNNSDREKAVQIASSVEGVRSVKNDLVVVSGS